MSMINMTNTTPFLEGGTEAQLQANDPMTVNSVYVANTQEWFWQAQSRMTLLVRTHALMHGMGMEEGNPLHDQCKLDILRINLALARADRQVWN